MMIFDVRIAALDDNFERRVRLAVSLLGAERMQAHVAPWDGTRCHLLIASSDDEYGRRALLLAQRRGTPVLALGTGSHNVLLDLAPVSPVATAASLVREIRQRLVVVQSGSVRPQGRGGIAGKTDKAPLICRLAQAPLRGSVVVLKGQGRTILIHPAAGRAYSHGASDLLLASENLAAPDWKVRRIAHDAIEPKGMASISLEAFLLRAARSCEQELPPFPQGRYQLKVWPDLGAVPDMIGALKLAKSLIDRPLNAAELLQQDKERISQRGIEACLWAFAAADLLRDASKAGPSDSPLPGALNKARFPWWSAITRRFGL